MTKHTATYKVTWDSNDKHWMNQYSLKMLLEEMCHNTSFEVEEV